MQIAYIIPVNNNTSNSSAASNTSNSSSANFTNANATNTTQINGSAVINQTYSVNTTNDRSNINNSNSSL